MSRMSSKAFLRDAGIVMLATTIANVCNLLFQLYMVRNLSVSDFGVLTALLTGLFIFSVPCFAVQAVVAKWSAEFLAKGALEKVGIFFGDIGKWVVLFGVALLIVGTAASMHLSRFLNMEDSALIVITVISVVLATIFPLWLGLLQGTQRFWAMGGLLVWVAITRLILGVALVEQGWGVHGAMWSALLSFAVALPLAWFFCRSWTSHSLHALGFPRLPGQSAGARTRSPTHLSMGDPAWSRRAKWFGWGWQLKETPDAVRYLAPAALSYLCFTLLTQSDIILVKHFFPVFSAGIYATGSMVGKIVLFLPLAVSWVLLPKAAGNHARSEGSVHILKVSLYIVTIVCTGAALAAFICPEVYVWLFRVSYTDRFIPLARLFAVAMSFYALTQVVMTYQLSVRNLSFLVPTICLAVLQIVLISFFHHSLRQVLWILCGTGFVVFAVNLSRVRWQYAEGGT